VKIGGRCMKMSPDGLSLVIGSLNGNIHVFDMQTFQQTACFVAHDSEVLSVDFGQSIDMS
jgi:WD40 repeat protein